MNLVWHIAKKDLRRMALPVALWLAFVVGTAIWFRRTSPAASGQNVADLVGWLPMMGFWVKMLLVGALATGFLLAGAMAIEDPLLGTDQFWMTRPIGNARLLSAKLLSGSLLFVVAPLSLLLAVDLGSGFSFRELGWSVAENAPAWMSMVALAIFFGAVARNLAQFLFQAIGIPVGIAVLVAVANLAGFPVRLIFPDVPIWTAGLLLIAHQFLTRRTMRTWILSAAAVELIFAGDAFVQASKHGKRSGPKWGLASESELARHADVAITIKRVDFTVYNSDPERLQANLTIDTSPAGTTDGVMYAPMRAVADVVPASGKAGEIFFEPEFPFGDELARMAALGISSYPRWYLYGDTATGAHAATAQMKGQVAIWRTKPVVLGELSAKLGSEFSHGSSSTRVIAVEATTGWDGTIVVEERDSLPPALDQKSSTEARVRVDDSRQDFFLQVNRAAQRAEVVLCDEIGTVAMRAHVVGFRRLFLRPATEQEAWRKEAVIVKVRLERAGEFWRPFEIQAPVVKGER